MNFTYSKRVNENGKNTSKGSCLCKGSCVLMQVHIFLGEKWVFKNVLF